MDRFTPGPWRYFDPIGENTGDDNDYFTIQSQADRFEPPAIDLTAFLSEADARLIASAPDLLAALRLADARFALLWPDRDPSDDAAWQAVHEAIGRVER